MRPTGRKKHKNCINSQIPITLPQPTRLWQKLREVILKEPHLYGNDRLLESQNFFKASIARTIPDQTLEVFCYRLRLWGWAIELVDDGVERGRQDDHLERDLVDVNVIVFEVGLDPDSRWTSSKNLSVKILDVSIPGACDVRTFFFFQFSQTLTNFLDEVLNEDGVRYFDLLESWIGREFSVFLYILATNSALHKAQMSIRLLSG